MRRFISVMIGYSALCNAASAQMAFPLDSAFPPEREKLLESGKPLTAKDVFPDDPQADFRMAYECGGVEGLNKIISATLKRQEIHYAAIEGDVLRVKELLVEYPEDLNARDALRATPLILAAKAGRLGAVKALLEAGADPSLTDGGNATARDWAESQMWPEIVEVLDSYTKNQQEIKD